MPPIRISLAGTWEFRFDEEIIWHSLAVPGCWETPDGPKNRSGPAWYRTYLSIPSEAHGRRIQLAFGGISYACEIFLDGQPIGAHIGLWDAFDIDLSMAAIPGNTHELLIKVEKPAGLVAGPDSASLPGRYPLRTTLAGFLPYVWGQIFGGIWQHVELVIDGPACIVSTKVRGTPDGLVLAEIVCTGPPSSLMIEIRDSDGVTLHTQTLATTEDLKTFFIIEYCITQPRPWFPESPVCYILHMQLGQDDTRTIRFGLRSLQSDGTDILLNDRPIYPRMALSWGWYSDLLHCNPGPERIRAEFSKLKALGYNGIKLCLWIPPQDYFDLADELGMLLWVELPMWLPQPDDHFHKQVPIEYERIVRQVCGHPSVILYSLGCELNRAVGPELLAPLYTMVKQLAGDALVRDNSGSGEAYGGLLNEYADYYDYHFYSDIHFFRNLIDYFTPRWRPVQPWVFGEFCDLDTFRDIQKLIGSDTAIPQWWLSTDPAINPQGARWQFDLPFYQQRLLENGLWERSAEFTQLSHEHALLHRKWTLETVRSYREIGGYVITGEVDTPISTAGMWDDHGILKFAAEEYHAFNHDLVLTIGWDKRRNWVNGGDRAAYWDTWSYRASSTIRPHLIISHYGATSGSADLRWSVALDGEAPFAEDQSTTAFTLAPGTIREVAIAEFAAPMLTTPRRAILRAELTIGNEQTANSWPLWFFPKAPWAGLEQVGLIDPRNLMAGIERLISGLVPVDQNTSAILTNLPAIITTIWTPTIDSYVKSGGRALLLEQGQEQGGPLPTIEMPFWREALRVAEPHPAWGDFPHDGWAGLQFFGCATDRALDLSNHPQAYPILRRVDVRSMASHAYIAQLTYGQGHLIVTTLRIQGGQGEQPVGVARNTAAAYLLTRLVRSLTGNML